MPIIGPLATLIHSVKMEQNSLEPNDLLAISSTEQKIRLLQLSEGLFRLYGMDHEALQAQQDLQTERETLASYRRSILKKNCVYLMSGIAGCILSVALIVYQAVLGVFKNRLIFAPLFFGAFYAFAAAVWTYQLITYRAANHMPGIW